MTGPLHNLLKRQLKLLPVRLQKDPEVAAFIDAVNRAYLDFDEDRKLLERSSDLSSEELSEMTQELARSNRELEQFAYIASHDLQEPLRMVTSYTKLLAQRYQGKLGADADEFIHFANDGAVRMRSLIEDLLTYSRTGTHAKALERVEMSTVLNKALLNLKIAVEESGADITFDALPTVMADENAMVQVFQNLIGNALKFRAGRSPQIHIGCRPADGKWLFSVKDNGIGIDPAYFERIFLIFKRLHTREEYPGTGIGLAVCQKIILRHGGKIWLESEREKGTTFFFTLFPS